MERLIVADEPALALPRVATATGAPLSFGLFALSRALHTYGTALLADLGLYPGQELIVMHLLDAGEASASEMIAALGLDHSTVSRSLTRMERAGLIERTPSTQDRRKIIVRLTPMGISLKDPLTRLWAAVDAAVTSPLVPEEQKALGTLAIRVEEALTRAWREKTTILAPDPASG